MEESGLAFNKVNEQSRVGEDPFTTFDIRSPSTPTPLTTTSALRSPSTATTHSSTTLPTTTAAPRSPSTTTPIIAANPSTEDVDDLVSGPIESNFLEEEGSDYSTEDNIESKCGLVGDDDEDYGSDVHEKVRELRPGKRSFQRRKRKERVPADTKEVPVGEAGADLVEYEKKETWTWFIKLLKEDLGLGDGEDLTLITDMQKVLQENINRLMNCNIEFNGVDGFEVREGPFQHSVDLGSKATYLMTYVNVLQPVTNMEMWHVSTNPTVAPPKIKSMPDRPGKLRKKEAGESKKSRKLLRIGLAMTCSNCNVRGHNKRGCPQKVESSAREEPSNTDKENGKTSGLGRPKKAQTEGKHSTKRSRGRPPAAPSASSGPAKWSRGRPPTAPSASPGSAKRSRRRPPAVPSASAEPSASAAPTKGARRRPSIAPTTPNTSATSAKSARGRLPAAASAPPTCPSPANYHPGMSSCKIFSTGTTKVTKSADVTGDVGYKPSTAPKLKWNGKVTISTRKLQEMREEQRKKSRGSSSNNPI
ncbi:hypothetical protein MTR67_021929 [Solanum verrucosum]|uniref:Uncharacterized protein n=1 Tax=Solanum verrucosum TaxID=315347 RepID=A0AAF0QQX6_SOLVR|nr:hypothetical protein MTR67_021929 [Solanum verrucosum]